MFMKWFGSRSIGASAAKCRPILRTLEQLEDRCTPALFRWQPINGYEWSKTWQEPVTPLLSLTYSNWYEENATTGIWTRSNRAPGENDNVFFTAGAANNKKCIVDNDPFVRSVEMQSEYAGTIQLKWFLTVAHELKMRGPGSITGYTDDQGVVTRGELTVLKKFLWDHGNLADVKVNVVQAIGPAMMSVGTDPIFGASMGMRNVTLDVSGILHWGATSVSVLSHPENKSQITIKPAGQFWITATGNTWGSASTVNDLQITNQGKVSLGSTGTATIFASYTTTGTTELVGGTLAIAGAEQNGGTFNLLNGSTITTSFLGIRDGVLIGTGTINGSLVMGRDPLQPNYALTVPLINPGGAFAVGTIHVAHDFHMYNGHIGIDVAGAGLVNGQPRYDRIVVGGVFRTTNANANSIRRVQGYLVAGDAIPANSIVPFLAYTNTDGEYFLKAGEPGAPIEPPTGWTGGRFWFQSPNAVINERKGKVGGKAWDDNGAIAGVFEPAVEGGRAGVVVRLLDSFGMMQIATTTTDANGAYEFPNLTAGTYVVEFVRPTGERFAPGGGDSDAHPTTGRVTVQVYSDLTDIDAGFYDNAAPIVVDDTVLAHKNTATAGTVRTNDTDATATPSRSPSAPSRRTATSC